MSVGRSSLILLFVSTLSRSPLIDAEDGFIAVRIEVKHRLANTACLYAAKVMRHPHTQGLAVVAGEKSPHLTG